MENQSIKVRFVHLFWYALFAVSIASLVMATIGSRVTLQISPEIGIPLSAIDYWTKIGLYSFFAVLVSAAFLLLSARKIKSSH